MNRELVVRSNSTSILIRLPNPQIPRLGSGCVAPGTLITIVDELSGAIKQKRVDTIKTFLKDNNQVTWRNDPLERAENDYDILLSATGKKIVPVVPVFTQQQEQIMLNRMGIRPGTLGELRNSGLRFFDTPYSRGREENTPIPQYESFYDISFNNSLSILRVSQDHPFDLLLEQGEPEQIGQYRAQRNIMTVRPALLLQVGNVVASRIAPHNASKITNIQQVNNHADGIYNLIVASKDMVEAGLGFQTYGELIDSIFGANGNLFGLSPFDNMMFTNDIASGTLNLQAMFEPQAYENMRFERPGN